MNIFNTIDAQCPVSILAQVSAREATEHESAAINYHAPQINRRKLVAYNLRKPLNDRINGNELQARLESARIIANANAIGRQIRAEVEFELIAERNKWENL